MVSKTFAVHPDATTRQINGLIRKSLQATLQSYTGLIQGISANEEIRSRNGVRRYVFGISNELRDTLVATYEPETRQLVVIFPNGHTHWEASNFYDRVRVMTYHKILASRLVGEKIKEQGR